MNWKKHSNIWLAVCLLVMTLAVPAGAVTHYVFEGQSIQAAIDDANDGDEIQVEPGTYNEAIDFKGKAVRLYSSDGPGVTTINGNGAYHVVQCISGETANTILKGFTITGGDANGTDPNDRGAGMYNNNSSPTVTNCTFSGNYAAGSGGGMFNYQSSPTVTGCKYILNQTDFHGGGIYNQLCSPRVINCVFSQNMAAVHGGGMMNNDYSNPTVVNCSFIQNTANGDGGGIANSWFSSSTVTNCTFTNNTAAGGGGIYIYAGSLTATNCIFWGNTTEILNDSSTSTVTYSDVQGGTGQPWFGTGCINADPCFVDAESGDLRPKAGSPCIDAGNNNALPINIMTDLDGKPRFRDDANMPDTGFGTPPIVDMGAYEKQGSPIHNVTQGNYYLHIQQAINGANNGDEIEVAPGTYYEAINFSGKAVRLYSSWGPQATTIDANGAYHVVQCISGEDANTILEGFTITGGNANGSDFNGIGGGMYNSNSSPTVTNCTFSSNSAYTNGGGMYNDGSSPTVTNCTFSNNTGNGMSNVSSSPTINNCTFSGNSANYRGGGMYNTNNSSPTVTNCTFFNNTSDFGCGGMYNTGSSPTVTNCTFSNNTGNGMYNHYGSSPTLDGCTFSGNSFGGNGGGMYNQSSSPTLTNCNFTGNSAGMNGGGMYNYDNSSPMVTDCNFSGNTADSGGGMHNENSSSPTVTDCTFSGNTATNYGGGMNNYDGSSPTVTNCNFTGNSVGMDGGGMRNYLSNLMVTNCTFSGNTANYGGGMFNAYSSPTVTNCSFTGNEATYNGGGMFNNTSSNPIVTNCTFTGNTATSGGGMYNYINSYPTVTNCIFWNDTPNEIYNNSSSPTVTYSDVQGGYTGTGNIDADPCFIDANAGDLRLKPNSPCIDAGNNTAVPSSVLKDLAGKLRFADDPYTPDTGNAGTNGRPVVDMGAYEFQGCGTTSQNLLANPGFEVGDATGWITNWGWNLTATTEQTHDGNYSGLASARTDSWQGAWQSVQGLMDDGKTYRISGWVRLQDSDSNYVALTVKKVDSTGDHYYGIDNATAYSDKWVNLDGTLNFDANESMTDLYIYFEGPAADVNFFVDDAAVTEVKGDMDHNGRVDFIDFGLFASYYGFDCSTQDCGRANLDDSDNTINERDLAILCNNWLAGTEP